MMKTLREHLLEQEKPNFNGRLFKNDQSGRLSGQGYGASKNLQTLTFEEFIESYFGDERLSKMMESDDFEVEHASNVLWDEVI